MQVAGMFLLCSACYREIAQWRETVLTRSDTLSRSLVLSVAALF